MENETRVDRGLESTELVENETIVRIENDNSRDSCYYMKYFLDSVMVGVPFIGSPKYQKEKGLDGNTIEDVMVLREGELTEEHDSRNYLVCLTICTIEKKYYLLTVAQRGDTVEWNNEAQELKVIRRKKEIMTLKRDLIREQREKNLA